MSRTDQLHSSQLGPELDWHYFRINNIRTVRLQSPTVLTNAFLNKAQEYSGTVTVKIDKLSWVHCRGWHEAYRYHRKHNGYAVPGGQLASVPVHHRNQTFISLMNDYVQIAYKNNLDVHYILCECPNCERDNSRDEERMYQ